MLFTARPQTGLNPQPALRARVLRAWKPADGADVLLRVRAVGRVRSSRVTPDEPAEIGVKRVSVGSALSRAALGAFLRAAQEMRESGTFLFADEAVSYQDISAMFEK